MGRKQRPKTKIIRIRENIHTALRIYSALKKKSMTDMAGDLLTPELRRQLLIID